MGSCPPRTHIHGYLIFLLLQYTFKNALMGELFEYVQYFPKGNLFRVIDL